MTTSTDLEVRDDHSLAISEEQQSFTPRQIAVLEHIGIKGAPQADLDIFFYQCIRTGLDPFARQIHMIMRKVWNPETQQKEPRWTIQTGIDGFRVMGHRIADQKGVSIEVSAYEWLNENGQWMPAWSKERWGYPLAAKSTILRDGKSFTAVANYDEYVQRNDRGPTGRWRDAPGGQLAKCAEALAWRMAFPQDMSGVYVDEEMEHADNPDAPARMQARRPVRANAAAFARHEPHIAGEVILEKKPVPEDLTEQQTASPTVEQRIAMSQLFEQIGVTDNRGMNKFIGDTIGRVPSSEAPLSQYEADTVISALNGEVERRG